MSADERRAIAARHLFDGADLLLDRAVTIEGDEIVAVPPRRDLPAGVPVRTLPDGAWLAPGFIDVQVNGGGDVLFNDSPTPEGLLAIAAAHRRFGVTGLLPTLITDGTDKMRAAARAVEAVAAACPSVLGIHFEGPWLSPDKPGAHDPALIRAPGEDEIELVAGRREGVTLVTLAPERVPAGLIATLARAGVTVALGHSMATYEETRAAIAEGLSGVTHLFNAMRPLGARDPGPVAAALECADLRFGMIVDGHHVAPPMLKLALRGAARPMLVSDAMPPVGGARRSFTLYGQEISLRDGRCLRADGTLAGAALDMAGAVRNAVRLLDMPLPAALRAASTEPAAFLGLDRRLGRVAAGYRADLVAFDPADLTVLDTWVAGRAGEPA